MRTRRIAGCAGVSAKFVANRLRSRSDAHAETGLLKHEHEYEYEYEYEHD